MLPTPKCTCDKDHSRQCLICDREVTDDERLTGRSFVQQSVEDRLADTEWREKEGYPEFDLAVFEECYGPYCLTCPNCYLSTPEEELTSRAERFITSMHSEPPPEPPGDIANWLEV